MNNIAAGEASRAALHGSPKDFSKRYRTAQAESSFVRAQQILRQETALTLEQFEELDELLRKVSNLQFGALVDDPRHHWQLRNYEVLSWRRGTPLLLIIVVLLLLVAAAGTVGLRLGGQSPTTTGVASAASSTDTATGS